MKNNIVLDFSGVFATGDQKPAETHSKRDTVITATVAETLPEAHTEDESAQYAPLTLCREAEQRKQDHQRSKEVYKTYQKNIHKSETLQTEIIKGLSAGEDIYSLFLKAVEALASVTNDNQLYKQAEADIREVYGVGLRQEQPIRRELEAVEHRLYLLEESLLWETESGERKRIERAIEAHKQRAEKLQNLIPKAG